MIHTMLSLASDNSLKASPRSVSDPPVKIIGIWKHWIDILVNIIKWEIDAFMSNVHSISNFIFKNLMWRVFLIVKV